MYNDFDSIFKPLVLITGFGPFENNPVNASWEAVRLINKQEIEDKFNIELVTIELSVTYEDVDEYVPALWDTHTPKLVIHVGVSGIAECFTLETTAHRKGYKRKDFTERCPANQTCGAEGAVRIYTKLDVDKICELFNASECATQNGTKAVSSNDAGRYLCEYCYYTSLSVDSTRSLFVHVPSMNVYTPEQSMRGLVFILEECLRQVSAVDQADKLSKNIADAKLDSNDI